MSCPDSHQGRGRKQISIRGNDECRRGDGRDFRESVWRARGLIRRIRLARMLIDLDPALCAFRVSSAIGWPNLSVDRRQFPDVRNFDARDEIGDLFVCHLSRTRPDYEASKPLRTPRGIIQSSESACRNAKQVELVELEMISERLKITSKDRKSVV